MDALETRRYAAGVMDEPVGQDASCKHHWVLGQPQEGRVTGVCRNCGVTRHYPAYLEGYDWTSENERRFNTLGVATAAGGARPSSGALLPNYDP